MSGFGDYDRWKCDPDWGKREEKCQCCGGVKGECDREYCARCGLQACTASLVTEEGDEFECHDCNERENARERCKHTADMFGGER